MHSVVLFKFVTVVVKAEHEPAWSHDVKTVEEVPGWTVSVLVTVLDSVQDKHSVVVAELVIVVISVEQDPASSQDVLVTVLVEEIKLSDLSEEVTGVILKEEEFCQGPMGTPVGGTKTVAVIVPSVPVADVVL